MQILEKCDNIKNGRTYSEELLGKIRIALKDELSVVSEKIDFSVVTTGSFARREASQESDIDIFILCKNEYKEVLYASKVPSVIKSVIETFVLKEVGDSGTFGCHVIISEDELTKNIGGNCDSNENLTRRMLLLLEGDYLYGKDVFYSCRENLIKKYIKDDIPQDCIAKFFLNDIIRYYRTICTDYEFKVSESGKSWGVRNIKLRFSRKLLYFSGIILVAESQGGTAKEKITKITDLLNTDPISRLSKISCKEAEPIFLLYDNFLSSIFNGDVRRELDSVTREGRKINGSFQKLKEQSYDFSRLLEALIERKYGKDHQIYHALMF